MMFFGILQVHAQTITICYQVPTGNPSPYNPDGVSAVDAVAKLENTANFGPSGAICGFTFQFTGIAENFTESSLSASGCQIWWSGFEHDLHYTAAESAAILSFSSNGGQVIAGCDNTTRDPMCALLGLDLAGLNGGAGTSEVTSEVNACFPNLSGTINNGGGAMDGFTNASVAPYTTVTVAASNVNNVAALNGLATAVFGNGIFATTDVNMFTYDGCCLSTGNTLTNGNDFFLADAMCALADAAVGNGACLAGDTDGDGITNDTDTSPNDPCLPAQSAGYTGYAAGNATWAAADCDGDGQTNGTEATGSTDPYDACSNSYTATDICNLCNTTDGTNQSLALCTQDCDGGSINNAAECDAGTDPTDGTDDDTDGDGIADNTDTAPNDPCLPAQSTGYTGYNAGNATWAAADCDGDGLTNGTEVTGSTDPYDACSNSYTATDICNLCNTTDGTNQSLALCTQDCDGGSANNAAECDAGTDPTDGTDDDTDGDGIADNTDTAPNDPCLPAQSAGYTGYNAGNATWTAADCDGDGLTNGTEVTGSTDPYDACSNSYTATDICNLCNTTDGTNQSLALCTQDCDGGSLNNVAECDAGTDPTDGTDDVSSCSAGTIAPILIKN